MSDRANEALVRVIDGMLGPPEDGHLDRDEVQRRFCRLASQVAFDQFKYKESADCFCGSSSVLPTYYRFSSKVMEYIEQVVLARLRETA